MIAIARIEPSSWRGLTTHDLPPADTEHGEAFGAACAYLARRDPAIFLRRHLAGDPRALSYGQAAYEWSGDYRSVLDAVYRFRLRGTCSVEERAQIQAFIAYTRDQNPPALAA